MTTSSEASGTTPSLQLVPVVQFVVLVPPVHLTKPTLSRRAFRGGCRAAIRSGCSSSASAWFGSVLVDIAKDNNTAINNIVFMVLITIPLKL